MLRTLIAVALIVLSSAAFGAEPFEVTIERGLAPRMTPDRVAERALEHLRAAPGAGSRDGSQQAGAQPSIRRMTCVRGADVERIVPSRMGPRTEELVWVVEADGDFRKTNPTGAEIRATQGFMVIDDATGLIVRVGSLAPEHP